MSLVSIRLKEWRELVPETTPELRGKQFLDAQVRAQAARLTESHVLEVEELRDGIRVKARAHVGRVCLDPLLITIEPKLGSADLLELLQYAYRLPPLRRSDMVDVDVSGPLLPDLLAARLYQEAEAIVRGGVTKAYVPRRDWLASPRGRIDLEALATNGDAAVGRLPCRHHTRLSDNHLNRVLLAGLQLARSVAVEPRVRGALGRLASTLQQDVAPQVLSQAQLGRASRHLTRLTRHYEPALRLIQLLFDSSAIALDDDAQIAVTGFLFDMNRFFQALMLRLLKEGLPESVVQAEEALLDMMRYVPGENPRRRRSPRPRPDFVITSPDRGKSLLDAKYRDLWAHELPREMLYQLSVYALSQPPPSIAKILYPTTEHGATPASIAINDPIHAAERARVVLQPVVLPKLVSAVSSGSKNELGAFARSLVALPTP
jgi:5-methylcytosine-specific restriction enzyme subunit McrC